MKSKKSSISIVVAIVAAMLVYFAAESTLAQSTIDRFRVTSSLAPGIFTSRAEAEAAQRAFSPEASILQLVGQNTNRNTTTYSYAAVPATSEPPARSSEIFWSDRAPDFTHDAPQFSSEGDLTQALSDFLVASIGIPPIAACGFDIGINHDWIYLTQNWISFPSFGHTDNKEIRIRYATAIDANGNCFPFANNFGSPFQLYRSYELTCQTGYLVNATGEMCQNNLTATITEVNLDYDLEPEECVGKPCNPFTGSEILSFQDIEAPGIVFDRVWRSRVSSRTAFAGDPIQTADQGRMPYGWSHSYGQRVLFDDNGAPEAVYRPNGTLVPLEETAGNYFAVNGSALQLRSTAADQWTVYLADGSSEIYQERSDVTCSAGIVRLESVVDPSGRSTAVEYSDICSIHPDTIRGPFGHTVQIQYQPLVDASTPRSIAAIVDSAGETITFGYTLTPLPFTAPRQVLDTVTYQDGSVERYHYESQNHAQFITGVTDEEGIRYSTVNYDLSGRTASASLAGGFNAHTFEYRTNGEIHVTNGRGIKSIYVVRDSDFDGVGDERLVIRRSRIVKTTTNDDQGQQRRTSITDSNQLTTSFSYDNFHLTSMIVSGPNESRVFGFEYLNDTSALPRVERGPSSCDDGTIPPRQYETETTYVTGTQLIGSVVERGFRKDVSGTCVPIERTTTYSNHNAFGQPELIDGPRTDVTDTFTLFFNECTNGNGCGRPAYIENALVQRWTFDLYDAYGNVRRVTRPNGLVSEYVYDLRTRLTDIMDTNATGTQTRTTTFSYYDNGLIRRITEPTGAYFEYFYDNARNLVEIRDVFDNSVLYDYDLSGNRTLEQYVDASGTEHYRRGFRYDSFDQVDRAFLPASDGGPDDEWQWVTDATGLLESATSPLGNVTNYLDYDDFRNLTVIQDARGKITDFEYDPKDNLTSATAPNGALASYEYDDFGRVIKEVSPDRGTLIYTYDNAGNRVSELDARGKLTTYSFDALNRRTLASLNDGGSIAYEYDIGSNAIGRLNKITDATGTTEWAHDNFGAVTQKTQTIGTAALTTSYIFDPQGRLSTMTLPSGKVIGYSYNVFQVSQVSVDGQTILSGATYKPFGPINGWMWGNGDVSSREFNLRGLMTSFTLAADIRSIGYDADGRMSSAVDDSTDEAYGYDQLGRLTNFDPANGSGNGPVFTGSPVLLTSIQTMKNEIGAVPSEPSAPWMTVATKKVTATSVKVSLERGQVNTGSIDVKEKIGYVAIEATSGGSFIDSDGNTISYEAQTTPEFIQGWGTGCYETSFVNSYPSKPVVMASLNSHNGGDGGWLRRCKLNTTVLGLTVDEDKFGDLERKHNKAESAGMVAFSSAFDALFTDQNGSWGMEIAKITLPSTVTNPNFTSVTFRQSYATKPVVVVLPNKNGNNPASLRIRNVSKTGFEVVQVEPAPQNGTHNSMPIHYLAIETGSHTLPDGTQLEVGRKATKKQKHGAGVVGQEGWATVRFGDDEPTMMSQVFGYDDNGNRTSLTENGSLYLYSYLTNSNRLLSTTGPATKTINYDASGNITSDGLHSYGYDDRGRLVDVDLGATTYAHNGQGQRVRKDNGAITLFAYGEAGELLGEYDAAGNAIQETVWLNQETVWFNSAPVAVLTGTGNYYVHTDQLGTPRAITDGNTVIWRWESDPFGTTGAQEDPDGDSTSFTYNLRFPGQYYDDETGLHYNYYRTYDPSIGRYLRSDPIGFAGGPNSYSYVELSPLRRIDPLGLIWETVDIDYHGTKNWLLAIFDRLGEIDEGTIMSPKNCEGICTRDVIQEWVVAPTDPQEQREVCLPDDPFPGQRRKIEQTIFEVRDEWTGQDVLIWEPHVPFKTYEDF